MNVPSRLSERLLVASNYPASLDVFPAGLPLSETAMNDSTVEHAAQHRLLAEAVAALQKALGVNPGGAYTSVVARLDAASYKGHTHTIANITGLQAALNSKSDSSHRHSVEEIEGLQTALNGKAGATHSHELSEVTGLQAALDNKAGISTIAPKALATSAAVGTSKAAAREDHVHPLPSLSTLGAAARSSKVNAGAGLSGGGPLTGDVTLSANLTASGGSNGSATTVARGDHNHDNIYPRIVVQTLGSELPNPADYPAGTIVAQY